MQVLAGRVGVVRDLRFPDAERVREAIERFHNFVKGFKLVGRWVTSRVNNTEEEYMTTKEIFKVSVCAFS